MTCMVVFGWRRAAAAVAAVVAAVGLVAGLAVSFFGVQPPPRPAGATASEVDAYLSDMLDATWLSSGLDGQTTRPRVPTGELQPPAEFAKTLSQCFAQAGYELTGYSWGSDQGYILDTHSEAASYGIDTGGARFDEAKQLAFYTCIARHPQDPVASGELVGAGQRSWLYDRYASWTIPCLESLGYTVADVPTRAVFEVAPYLWSPYEAVEGVVTPGEYEQVVRRCGTNQVAL